MFIFATTKSRGRFGTSKMHSRPSTDSDLACCLISKARPGFVVFNPLIIVAHINCVSSVFGPCFVFLYFFVGKGLTSWLSFVMSNCEVVTFPLYWVRCGA